jgi:hypothetical protein
MTRAKRPILSLLISLMGLVGVGLVIWTVPPGNWFVELLLLLLLSITLVLISAWLIGNTKRGVQVAIVVMGILIMRRLGILDGLTLGLWLIVVGLISLIN